MKLSLNYNVPTLERMAIDVKGKLDIQGKSVPLLFVKKKDSLEGSITISADEIKVADLKSVVTKKEISPPDDEGSGSAKPKIQLFTNAVIKNPKISGSRSANGFFELVMSGSVSGISGIGGDVTLFFVVQKLSDESTAVGILADVKSINPSRLLSAILGIDLATDKLPLLNNIELDLVFEGANKEMMVLKDADLNKLLAKYTSNGKVIAEGFRLKCTIPLRKIVAKTTTLPTVKNLSLIHI